MLIRDITQLHNCQSCISEVVNLSMQLYFVHDGEVCPKQDQSEGLGVWMRTSGSSQIHPRKGKNQKT